MPPEVTDAAPVDLLVIGGGINGAGIARDAAGRGLSVVLCEKGDLGSATSSASTKLIHGGLRYLEYYEFRLVREALMERDVLLRAAPHIIWPLRFVLPHHEGLRPAWLVRLGLFLYDHIGGRTLLPPTRTVKLRHDPTGTPLKAAYTKAFEYSDCWVEDSRLVVLNAKDAAERGAEILTRTACTQLRRENDMWLATLKRPSGTQEVLARAVVNAAGPWLMDVLGSVAGRNATTAGVRLIKGSHIVVPKIYDGPHCYIFQNADGRIVFAIPYEQDFTLIGTTDIPYEGDPAQVTISQEELAYLCAAASEYFEAPILPEHVVWTYSGVRPLLDDDANSPSAVTRDYSLDLDQPDGQAPLLSVFGGKITTYRKLAEHALEVLQPQFNGHQHTWTVSAPLPGGDIPSADFTEFVTAQQKAYPWIPELQLHRLCRAYGTRVDRILGAAKAWSDFGQDFGAGLTEAELTYLIREEWAVSAEDALWRRSKLGLHMSDAERQAVQIYFDEHVP